MTKALCFLVIVVGLAAGQGLWAAETKATQVELNESNIEQALAAREGSEKNVDTEKNAANVISAQTKETEIPVHLDAKKATADSDSPWAKMLLGAVVVGGLAVAAWLATRRYRFSNRQKGPELKMKVLNQYHLGPKRSLAVVRVAGESILIGVTDHHISLIKSLSLLDEDVPQDEVPQSFGRTFARMDQDVEMSSPQDDFSVSGIKDFVSGRLKNMRSLD